MTREEIRKKLAAWAVVALNVSEKKLVDDADLSADLGADSLDLLELAMEIEEEFDVSVGDDEIESAKTFGAVVETIERLISDQHASDRHRV